MRSAMEPTIGQRLRMGAIRSQDRRMGHRMIRSGFRMRMGKSMMPLLITAPLRPSIQSQLLLPRVRVLF